MVTPNAQLVLLVTHSALVALLLPVLHPQLLDLFVVVMAVATNSMVLVNALHLPSLDIGFVIPQVVFVMTANLDSMVNDV